MAVMAVREGLEFESAIESDSASVAGPALALVDEGLTVHCLRDLTRGGLTAALNEIAGTGLVGIEIEDAAVPVRDDVAAACEFLGLDPLGVACEGRLVAFVPAAEAGRALEVMRRFPVSAGAAVVGKVTDQSAGRVILASRIGTRRILDLPAGEQLPRIC
jgi:hydrogenase expression/formation protein HypE